MTIETPLFMQDATVEYTAKSVRRSLIAELYDEGVMDLASFVVTERGAGANFSVDVAAGSAIVTGDDETDQGNYSVRSTAVENVTIGAAPGSNSRYDLIVLKVNDPQAGGASGFNATLEVVAGVASSSPTVPAPPASAIVLAVIGPITSATASITTSLISDQRTLAGRRCTPGTIEATVTPVAPNGWLVAAGQSLLRSAYPALFAHIGTTHGAVDGTHFSLPDLRGRVPVGLDNMGGSDAGRLSVGNTLGGSGGAQTHTLSTAEMPAHSHTVTDGGHVHSIAHDHGSATSGTQSADHYHGVSIVTSTESAGHVHPMADGSGFTSNLTVGGTTGLGGTPTGTAYATTGYPDTTHTHDVNGVTGGAAVDHTHAVDLPNYTGNSVSATTGVTNQNTGGGGAHNNMQPYLLVNYLIRT